MTGWASGSMTVVALDGDTIARAWELAVAALEEIGDAAPALAAGLAALLVVPAIAVAAMAARGLSRSAGRASARRGGHTARAAAAAGEARADDAHCRAAFVCVGERTAARISAEHPVVRIGRQEDNDIRFAAGSVHRYHAIIQRTREAEYWVTDLSGPGGHGVAINGRLVARGRLSPGDAIRLGEAEVIFRAEA